MDLRKKIVLIGIAQLIIVVGVLFGFYYAQAKKNVQKQYVEKARSIVLTAESTREDMGKKWDTGIFTEEQLSQWANAGEMDKVLAAVPVVSGWRAAMAKAEEGGYEFRVPKFSPRNPQNEPDEVEARVLKMLESGAVAEHYEIDEQMNAIRYFRPVKLTGECMLCHGDPATSKSIWGNDQGLDPTGTKMENWHVGEVHGAFEVVQSLDQADAQIASSLWKGGGVAALFTGVGSVVFFMLVTRGVVKPIRRIVTGLNEGADQVNDAAEQVSSSSQTLAAGATEQASSLQETSSALEEMSAMTRTNADNAKNANTLAEGARTAASEGDKTMERLNDAMSAINESAEKISKIIKVIEEIAFQTNLLALNAAVEAARAGEHGKGFAVVADEVRNLAQRAAKAAGETTQLIQDSVNKASEGTQVASEVAESLSAIVTNIGKVSDLINGISTASDEQAQGVEQVNSAVTQMDRVTQTNASTAEESAAAAEQLSAQANALKSTVGELVSLVGGGGQSSGRPMRSPARKVSRSRLAPAKPSRPASAPPTGHTAAEDEAFMALDDDLAEF